MGDDEAIAILSAPDSYASMRSVEPRGIAVTIVAQKSNLLPAAIVGTIGGLICVFAGVYLLWNPPFESQQGLFSSASLKMIVMGCVVLGVAPLLALIHFVNGAPRNVELEAVPGRLKADRSIAGDRVVSTYGIEEALCLFNESNVLCIETRKGHSQLIAFGRQPINEAIGILIARHFWFPLDVDTIRVSKGIPGSRIERTVFVPKAVQPAQ